MLRAQLRSGVAQVGLALREPEEFTRRWHGGEVLYPWWVFLALAFTAILGTFDLWSDDGNSWWCEHDSA